jgi:glycosyltransferase involved in cell wall biosynthesis/ubiquinone/menaquinone biosynthesis C-methylase UbiE
MKSKSQKRKHFDQLALERDRWKNKNRYYYEELEKFISFLVPEGRTVLEIGCSTGDLLARLQPSRGVGIDFSAATISEAIKKYPHLKFLVEDGEDLKIVDTFDYVILSDCIGEFTDIWKAFRNLQQVTTPDSRIVVTYFNSLWEPLLRIGEKLGLKMPQDYQNWLNRHDIENLLSINGFEVIHSGYRLLMPKYIPILSGFCNSILAKLPIIKKLCMVIYLVARPTVPVCDLRDYSVTVIVPCRNELGNIRPAVERLPDMGNHTEIIFVDGNSNDGTVQEIQKLTNEYKGLKDIKLIHQVSPDSEDGSGHGRMLKLGKGDAVRKGFAAANGELLMILDADLTVPPEDLPKFYFAFSEGYGEFINGSRLVYPMEKEAMRFLNKIANKIFGMIFSWLLEQKVKDTLCGTKVLSKKDYMKIAKDRHFFGDFDPFGDFDLLFGASKQNLKITEVPIRYRERTYGEIKIERFRHGLLLLKMSIIAMTKLKFKY